MITDRRSKTGQTAVWQARLIMLVMINIAQLWILAAPVWHQPSIIKWWRPTSRSKTSSGYVREHDR